MLFMISVRVEGWVLECLIKKLSHLINDYETF